MKKKTSLETLIPKKISNLTDKIKGLNKIIIPMVKKNELIYKKSRISNQNKTNEQNNVKFILSNKYLLQNKSNNKLKHYPSSVREWKNSIYLYNKNNLNLIPHTTIYAMKIIKNFFNFYNEDLEKKVRTKRLLLRLRRLSSNKIYLSGGEFKHSNNNVLVNLYIFNRQKNNYLSKLKSVYLNKFLAKKNFNYAFIKLFRFVYKKGLDSVKDVNKTKYSIVKVLNTIEKNEKYKINIFKSISGYTIHFYKNLLNLTVKKLHLYFLYKQLVYINRSKLNYIYLRLLKKHLEYLYNKNVEFNIINLKRFYLNSDILFESVKLKLTRNKNKMRKIFNKLKHKVKIYKKRQFLTTIFRDKFNEINDSLYLKRIIFDKLKYKHVTGFRLEARGRLSKRYTASRSVSKLKYKGNLLNMDSSYRGLSSVILKGNLRSNIQYTKLKSKTKIGAFGLKG